MVCRKEDVKKVSFAKQDVEFQTSWLQKKAEHYRLKYASAAQLDATVLEALVMLTEANMKDMYMAAGPKFGGWKRQQKKKELSSVSSRFIIVYEHDQMKAFAHFQFTFEESMNTTYEIPVLYWYARQSNGKKQKIYFFFSTSYELQVVNSCRRKGLGRYLMALLEELARHYQMDKVVLTVLKCKLALRTLKNQFTHRLFSSRQYRSSSLLQDTSVGIIKIHDTSTTYGYFRYHIDGISPSKCLSPHKSKDIAYEILSKSIKIETVD
jgi:N-alpha-acetyltransferase 40